MDNNNSQPSFDNPFTNDEGVEGAENQSGEESIGSKPTDVKVKKPPFWYRFFHIYVNKWQKGINTKISTMLNDYREHITARRVLFIFLISLAYSLMHTAGPGHGKLILSSYFLTGEEKRKRRDAIIAGSIVAVTHTGMAIILSLPLFILIHSFGNQREMAEMSRRIGGIFVVVTGVVLMMVTVFKDRIKILSSRSDREKFNKLSLYTIAVLSGIVPCPLAWTVLVFAISYNMHLYGIISVLGMAIGAAITVGTTGFLVLMGKETALSHVNEEYAEKFAYNLRFAGGFVLFLLGIKMAMP
ncbi:MAG: hypothetical protein PVI26_02555 [Chitinispirillia bacterium]